MSKQQGNEFQILSFRLFGQFSRYKLAKCQDRFGDIVYMVTDAEKLDQFGLPDVIRQASSEEEAISVLE